MGFLIEIFMGFFMEILMRIFMAIFMGNMMGIRIGIIMGFFYGNFSSMASMGWPYDSFDCLSFLVHDSNPVKNTTL